MGTWTFLLEGSPLPRKSRWAVVLSQDQPSLQMEKETCYDVLLRHESLVRGLLAIET